MTLTKPGLATAGLRPGELAHLTGAHPTTVSRWLKGKDDGGLEPPRYALTIVKMWPHMPDDERRRMLAESCDFQPPQNATP